MFRQRYLNFQILIVVIGIVLVSGCVEQKAVCNPPYIKVGTSCLKPLNITPTVSSETTETITAIVSRIIDGDTIELQTGETVSC